MRRELSLRSAGSLSPKSASEKWVLDPVALTSLIRVVCSLFRCLFFVMEIFTRVRLLFSREGQKKDINVRSIGERTVIRRQNSFQRKDSLEVLTSWFDQDASFQSKTYEYRSCSEMLETMVVTSSFSAHAKHMAYLALNDKNKRKTVARVVEAVKSIQVRAKKSVKFRFFFNHMLSFLEDLEKSRTSSLSSFIDILAREMLDAPDRWYCEFIHSRMRAKNVYQNIYETTLATLSLFFREGAGLESFYLKGAWLRQDRAYNASLTLIMYCAVSHCTPSASNEINVTEFSGIERILRSNRDQKFIRYVSLSITKSEELFKDKMMWDITLNCCNEFVESAWSDECLERAVWALQHGIKFMDQDVYKKLEELKGKRRLDLTQLNALSLVAFSVSGMVRFSGMDDCVYKITQDPNAKIELHGTLPMPSIHDLMTLDLVRVTRKSQFIVKRIPGCHKMVRALAIGDRVRFVPCDEAVAFNARVDQFVG